MPPIRYTEQALRDLRRLDSRVADLILRRTAWVADHVYETNHVALRGFDPRRYRLRVGSYRAVYELREGGALTVISVGHRKDVYR